MLTTGLKCEYAANPRGIDARHPRLSWILEDDRKNLRGQAQTAFQILAATDASRLTPESADLWDSGRVQSPHSMAGYAGMPLVSPARCW
ncbi:MAG TPA: hypothetical protein VF806_06635, partial [Anaerolineaceae bacterium]